LNHGITSFPNHLAGFFLKLVYLRHGKAIWHIYTGTNVFTRFCFASSNSECIFTDS